MKYIQYVLCLLFLSSCLFSEKKDKKVLKVELHEESVSVKTLFSKLSVVPLETNDSSLLIKPREVFVKNDQYYVFDMGASATFVFNKQGQFIRRIGKKGQGPGEYHEICDVALSRYSNLLYMLSPFGSLYCYNSDGLFIKEIVLPPKSNYHAIEEYDKDLFVLWTHPSWIEESGISLFSKTAMKEVQSYWHENRILCGLNLNVFYSYNESVFYFTPFHRKTYHVGLDSLRTAYSWDFGQANIDPKTYFTLEESKKDEEDRLLQKYLLDSTIPYFMAQQFQNDKFYYAKLTYGFKTPKNLFYRKSDGKTFFFEKTSEGLSLTPIYFSDDCLICMVYNEDFPSFKSVLSKQEYEKLERRLDDDNPCLIKFYF